MSEKDNMDRNLAAVLEALLSLEYESQHFGFHPKNLLDLMYNAFFENTSLGLTEMKQHMIEKYSDIVPPIVIQSQTDRFLQDLVKKCDKCIDKLEVFLNINVFSIAPHIVLPEDQIHIKSPCTKEDDEKIDDEIEQLKREILEEKCKKVLIKQKLQEQKRLTEKALLLQHQLNCMLGLLDEVNIESAESLFNDIDKLLEMNVELEQTEE